MADSNLCASFRSASNLQYFSLPPEEKNMALNKSTAQSSIYYNDNPDSSNVVKGNMNPLFDLGGNQSIIVILIFILTESSKRFAIKVKTHHSSNFQEILRRSPHKFLVEKNSIQPRMNQNSHRGLRSKCHTVAISVDNEKIFPGNS